MSATPEGKIKARLKKLLNLYGVYYHMPVVNGMGSPSLDFICCVAGYFFAIETKAPGGKPTPRQSLTMQAMRDAGGFVFLVAKDEHFVVLEQYLALITGWTPEAARAHFALHQK